MKNIALVIALFISSIALAQSPHIHVDQFGYTIGATKVAGLSNPINGQNSNLTYSPADSLHLVDYSTGQVVQKYAPSIWMNGQTDTDWSGDQGWWIDFSNIQTIGTYTLVDPVSNDSSAIFDIQDNCYEDVLKSATKMYYYNRCNFSKSPPFAEPGWIDNANNFDNPLQDANCRFIYDQNNASLEKDLTGGWFDAGDYNKYVPFTMTTLHNLLWAYEENPAVFGDNYNIPESGNGIPDLLDEVKFELDWLMKMTNSDGSVHIKMGSSNYNENTDYPPSNNFDQRYYGPTCTSASLTVASVFAHAAQVFKAIPSQGAYANSLETQAIACWDYVLPFYNSNTLELDCDDGSIVAGDADFDANMYQESMIGAAIYLFRLTGNSSYNDFVKNNYLNSLVFGATANDPNNSSTYQDDWWDINQIQAKDAYLMYETLPGHDPAVAADFRASFQAMVNNDWEGFLGISDTDLYRAYLPNYFLGWGSNMSEGNMGILNFLVQKYGYDNGNSSGYLDKVGGHIHYIHGVNPLGKCYLSNTYGVGADNCANEIYHAWFADGSPNDNVQSSDGPAPGYLSGGANHTYTGSLAPPSGEPYLKAYSDFNDTANSSWEITEPAIYYQAAYIRNLSQLMAQAANNGATSSGSVASFPGDTDWKTLKTGAGGWLTGMDIHPSGSPVFVRSDVGGAYRYNNATNNWTQIVTAASIPAADVDWSKYSGVLSIVSAPSDNNRAYLAYESSVYISNDQGNNWAKTNFPQIAMEANRDYSKLAGERLGVDPFNADIVYMATIDDGLWQSSDAGTNWSLVSAIPIGAIDHGIRTTLWDESSNQVNSTTQVLYTFVDSVGVFNSTDGGVSWSDITPVSLLPSGEPLFYDAEINDNGDLYIVGETWEDFGNTDPGDDAFTSYGVLTYRNNNWEKVFDNPTAMGELALDPFNSDRAFIFSNGFTDTYRTNNLSAANPSWSFLTFDRVADSIPYLAWTDADWFSLGEIEFDPVSQNKLWIADGIGSWTSTDLSDSNMTWEERSAGQEHLVSGDLAALPDGKAVTLHWDRPVFHHDDIDSYPSIHQPSSRFNSAWSIDQSPLDPNYLVAVIEDHRFCCYDDETRNSGYSEDGGLTWTKFNTMPLPSVSQIFGEIAVSADSKDNIVWLPDDNRMPFYTTDRGNTWTQATLPGNSGICCLSGNFLKRRALTADRVAPGTFYIYDWGDGSIFRSTNQGQTWTKYSNVISSFAYNGKLMSVPTQEGHLLFSNGPEQATNFIEGLSISEDGGASWIEMTNTDKVLNFAVSKQAPTGTYPTIFIHGEVNGAIGFYRSEDKGATWTQIGQYPGGVYDWASVMVGDMENHERLYIGFSGNGFMYFGDLESGTTSSPNIGMTDIDIEIFPNPTDSFFVIQGDLSLYQIDVINALGQVVTTINSTDFEETIDLSTLGNGMYFIRLEHLTNSNLFVKTIIKQ